MLVLSLVVFLILCFLRGGPKPSLFVFCLCFCLCFCFLFVIRRRKTCFPPPKKNRAFLLIVQCLPLFSSAFLTPPFSLSHYIYIYLSLSLSLSLPLFFFYFVIPSLFAFFLSFVLVWFWLFFCALFLCFSFLKEQGQNYWIWKVFTIKPFCFLVSCLVLSFKSIYLILFDLLFPSLKLWFTFNIKVVCWRGQLIKHRFLVKLGAATKLFNNLFLILAPLFDSLF